jgi:hypothetical protein
LITKRPMRCTTGNPYLWQPEPGKQPDHSLGTPSGCPTDWVHLMRCIVCRIAILEHSYSAWSFFHLCKLWSFGWLWIPGYGVGCTTMMGIRANV